MQGFKSFAKKTEVLFDKGINVIVGPNGSGKSCSYDTIVTLSNGAERQLGELVEEQIKSSQCIKNLDDGFYVDGLGDIEIISLNKTTMKSEKKIVSKFIKREGDNLYNIRTRSGRELKATKCHPIMCFSNAGVNSKQISALDIGMFIATPRNLKIESQKEDVEFSRLMGYIIGDGYIAKDRIDFVNKDPEVLQDYEQLILKYSKWGIRKSVKEISSNTINLYSRDPILYQKIRDLYNSNSKTITSIEKNIPNYFLILGNKSIANLLAGLFDTDGSVRKDAGIIEYCAKNKSLVRQVQSLLLRFDIRSKIKRRVQCATNTLEKRKADYYYLYIYGVENLRRFYENIPLRVAYKKNNIYNTISKNPASNENVDLLPQEINIRIREITRLLGIKAKLLRKDYPAFMAYLENRCAPTRQGVRNILPLFHQKFALLHKKYSSLTLNQLPLIEFMDLLHVSPQEVSGQIGINKGLIRNHWAKQIFQARPQNLVRFRSYLSQIFLSRIQQVSSIITLLENISSSDVYWDRIVSIEKLDKPEFVYDLTVEGNHNFVANNIFAHNSNVSDALCFALGRLSAKSIRAEKTTSLLFSGTNLVKPAHEASVEIVFDNSEKTFNLPNSEITIERLIRTNGQGIYKINGETKTRGDIIEMLAAAGIDPYGFNLILQGQIQSIVKMHAEDRRKILEEVSGISIYETRKEKSLHELEKTEERLKEISTILRERKAFMNNLERERSQALRYKETENNISRCRYSILTRKISDVEKEINNVKKAIEEKKAERDKIRSISGKIQAEIDKINEQIVSLSSMIKRSSGVEREVLQEKISELRAEIEGLKVRIEGNEKRKSEFKHRIEQLKASIPEYKREIEELRKESPLLAKKQEELKRKKADLLKLEEEKNKVFSIKTELLSLKERIKEKESRHHRLEVDGDSLLKQIEAVSHEFKHKDEQPCADEIIKLSKETNSLIEKIEKIKKEDAEHNKKIAGAESQIQSAENFKERISKIDICPLCRNKMTQEHIDHVHKDCKDKIEEGKKTIEQASVILKKNKTELEETQDYLSNVNKQIEKLKQEYTNQKIAKEKQQYLKVIVAESQILAKEIEQLTKKREDLENKTIDVSSITEQYNSKLREIEETSSMTERNIDTTLMSKERELEAITQNIKNGEKGLEELESDIADMHHRLEQKESFLEQKENEEQEISKKFKKLFDDRDKLQVSIQNQSYEFSLRQTELAQLTEQINHLDIAVARFSASKESLEIERKDVPESEPIKASIEALQERLEKAKQDLQGIGSINMRALEVYESVKEEYDKVAEKVETLQKEKEEIMKIIAEIDQKKKRTFMKTFKGINELFGRNASELYTKGQAYLQLENEEDIFAGGVDIVIKLGKGKYFDVTSLSGGEQTLIALSLLFAIQEFKPYHFYVFDEIDAALDKRNSERLASLLNKYIRAGQYIIVTHNDALIMNSKFLYGISMHDGISKVFSLKLDLENKEQEEKVNS